MALPTITASGNLVFEPDFQVTSSGVSRCKMRIACNERKKAQDGTWSDGDTSYFDIVLWRGLAESAADTLRDTEGRLYKESFGMASNRAVKNRTQTETAFERAKKELFEEGISTSRMYLDSQRPGVEDIIDQIVAGLRSACTYAGASSIEEFHDRAVVGVQSAAGYDEGRPLGTSW